MTSHRATTRPRRLDLSLLLGALLCACTAEPPPAPEGDERRDSYAVGLHLGMRLRGMEVRLDPEAILAGFQAGVADQGSGATRTIDEEVIRAELERLVTARRAAAGRGAAHDLAKRNRAAGDAFLAANRTEPGVVELPSGVQYRVVAPGDEDPPALEDRVTVEYEARLLDGAVFDTSKDRFAPTILRLARTPRAWREVVPHVPGGASVEIWVPADLSSAEHPTGLVPPGELIVFTLRLAAIDRHRTPRVARAPP